jgi:ATPase subunit of ABC transporter with duplicated ATPase domains
MISHLPLPRNGIVGIIGPNGAGKTTLFKTLHRHGTTRFWNSEDWRDCKDFICRSDLVVESIQRNHFGKLFQMDLILLRLAKLKCHLAHMFHAFGFKGPDQQKPAGVLSGGERNRLNLALTLKARWKPIATR